MQERAQQRMTSTNQGRTRIATRIQELVRRELDHAIDVERLLARERYARDVLLVCDAYRGTELPLLAAEFRRLSTDAPGVRAPLPAARGGPRARPNDRAGDTSGFGVAHPPEGSATPAPASGTPATGWRTLLPWR